MCCHSMQQLLKGQTKVMIWTWVAQRCSHRKRSENAAQQTTQLSHSARRSWRVVAVYFLKRSLLKQVDAQLCQKRKIYCQLVKNWVVGSVWFLCLFLHFYNKMIREARHLSSLCRLNLLKLVCIRAISNNSRMFLQSKLLNSLSEEKK